MNLTTKKIIVALSMLFLSGTAGFAQCSKATTLTSSKTEYLDASMVLQRTTDENTVVELTDSLITIAPGNEPRKMIGNIKSTTCNWNIPYKEGKSTIKAIFTDDQDAIKNLTITIEGKGGTITLLAEIEEMPDRKIRLPVDTFKEKM